MDGSFVLGSSRNEFILSALQYDGHDCLIWPFAIRKSSGYGAHSVRENGARRNLDAHRYVCELAHGEPGEGMQAAHVCGSKLCVNPGHLYWATPQQNMDDAKRHRTLKGGGRYRQYIFAEQIEDICASELSLTRLAEKYNSDPAYIGRIKRQHASAVG